MKLVSLISLTAVSAEMHWEDFKTFHGKLYSSMDEEVARQRIYEANVQKILDHNARNETWTMAMNQFGDLTEDEFDALVSGKTRFEEVEGLEHVNVADEFLASSKDWVSEGVVNEVRDQGDTNSCWAHSAVGSLESVYAIATGELVKLSEQQLCDCSGCGSCSNGGDEQDALPWYKDHGACGLDNYRLGSSSHCNSCDIVLPAGTVTGTVLVNKDANSWKSGLNVAPFTMGVYAKNLNQFYSSGVLTEGRGGVVTAACSGEVNHAMVAVGYGTDGGQDYFKLRNSWGKSWGEHGYVRVARTSSASKGVACIYKWKPMYPTVHNSPHPSPRPSPSPPPSPSPSPSGCQDKYNWVTQEGDDCSDWEKYNYCTSDGHTGDGWKSKWGSVTSSTYRDNDGHTCFDACCACGGGSRATVV